jgi:hypothetical protein
MRQKSFAAKTQKSMNRILEITESNLTMTSEYFVVLNELFHFPTFWT